MKNVAPILEKSSISLTRSLGNAKKVLKESVKLNSLEKQPISDMLDFSLEESGKYRVGNRIVSIIFPR